MPDRLFVILTRGRTGSTVICSDINTHQNVVCHEELFRSTPVDSPYDMFPSYESVKLLGRTPSAEEYLLETAASSPAQVVGFKALLGDIERHEAAGLEKFLFQTAKIIFLTRDPIRAALSAAIAKQRGAFNRHNSLTDPDYLNKLATRVVLDPTFVLEEIRYNSFWSDLWQSRLLEANVPHILITYEDYVENRQKLLNRVFDFLGVGAMTHIRPAEYLKVTSENVWDDIINADEIRDLCRHQQSGA